MTNLLQSVEPQQSANYHDVKEQTFLFPDGILGFEKYKQYQLERFRPADGSESPFFLLRCIDEELSFPLIQPATLGIDYQLPITPELTNALKAADNDPYMVLLIVTVRERVEDTTINLQGPLVISPMTGLGLQLVIEEYPLRHPLLIRLEY